MDIDTSFLADSTTFSLEERDIRFCLRHKDYAKAVQRLIEELDPLDKSELKVSHRFAGAVLEEMFRESGKKIPEIITALAGLPVTPLEYQPLPRLFAKVMENGMMELQGGADEKWIQQGVDIQMEKLLKGQDEDDYSYTELTFFRLRARAEFYYVAKAYLMAWQHFQKAEELLPGRLADHQVRKRTDQLLEIYHLGFLLGKKGQADLLPEQDKQREAFRPLLETAEPALQKIRVNQPKGRLQLQGRDGVLIEDADIAFLEEAFELLPARSVKHVELRFCKLPKGKLPTAFFRFPKLTHLTIDSCGLRAITNNIAGFKQLRHLTIINAPDLEDLPLKLGGLKNLQSLTIDKSGVTDIPYSILECKGLQSIIIQSSRLTYVNGFLGELPQLTVADFSHNHIEEVEEGFMDAFRLRKLDLSHNRLSDIPDNLHVLKHLETLNLGQNPLEKIPAGILYMNALQFLQIDGKTINELDHYLSFKDDLRKKISLGEQRWAAWQGLW
ncbi:leucine-rich repeat domain-containing protein [Neolewinella persica]|uniref:leucine-rich repeat domain-containing protein n=1 Tax=Neolewinella persica TaxID=70998 RepID=UPI00036C4BDA|nr:leucine-rich repeat domain-containing protein [Neolewinella persica]